MEFHHRKHPAEKPENEQDKPPETPSCPPMATVTEVIKNALSLSLTDRSYVASKLIESLENEELTSQAIHEFDQRVARWKTGESRSSDSAELDAKARDILNR